MNLCIMDTKLALRAAFPTVLALISGGHIKRQLPRSIDIKFLTMQKEKRQQEKHQACADMRGGWERCRAEALGNILESADKTSSGLPYGAISMASHLPLMSADSVAQLAELGTQQVALLVHRHSRLESGLSTVTVECM